MREDYCSTLQPLVKNGRGSVFFGPSGSGKTTIARLSAGRTILSDEMVIVKPHNGGYRVYGTPFWSEFSPDRSNTRAELDGLYSLKKDQRNSLRSLDKVHAAKNLYQCVPFFSDDGQLQSRILDTCRTLVDTVPVYELHFLPDPSFWQVLNEHNAWGKRAVTFRCSSTSRSIIRRDMMKIRKAVITAAGWGTRFLPVTKSQPKEMLPLVNKPLIQYSVEEAVACGVELVVIVTALGKRAIEDYFDRSFELEQVLEQKGETQTGA